MADRATPVCGDDEPLRGYALRDQIRPVKTLWHSQIALTMHIYARFGDAHHVGTVHREEG